MFRHVLFFSFDTNTENLADKIKSVRALFLNMKGDEGVTDVEWSENISTEGLEDKKGNPNKQPHFEFSHYDYVVVMTFADHQSLCNYLEPSPRHEEIQQKFDPILKRIAVADYEVPVEDN